MGKRNRKTNGLKIRIIFGLFFYTSFLFSQTLQDAFYLAGDNKESLTAVLEHYKNIGEEEKYKAAVFLIENMPIHKSVNYKWVDGNGDDIGFSELAYTNFDTALNAFNKIKDSIKITPEQFSQKDIEVISSDLLIKNIEMAFKQWKENPWSENYSFETFCEYILPYRSLIEPLENWREDYLEFVKNVKNSVDNTSDPVEVCWSIISELKDFKFITKRPDPIPLLSPQQLLFRRQGSCPDLANAALFASRSLGVAVSFDFTPHYAASSNRHYWNTVIDNEGNHIPFNGNLIKGSVPAVYIATIKRLGKVFRKTYSIQKNALANKIDMDSIPKSFLKNTNLIDVTNEYLQVGKITYRFPRMDSHTIAYLNVFNSSKWRVTDWAEKENNQFVYKNLGRDVVYLPSLYKNGQMLFAKYPILLDVDGKSYELKPDKNARFGCNLSRYNEPISEYVDNNSVDIKINNKYILMCWDGGWKKIGMSEAKAEGVFFQNLPSNALFMLLPLKRDGYERVFTINSTTNKISWY